MLVHESSARCVVGMGSDCLLTLLQALARLSTKYLITFVIHD